MSQTTNPYSDGPSKGLPGGIVDTGHDTFIRSLAVETVAGIEFGRAVEAGTAANQAELYAGGTLLGVAVRSQIIERDALAAGLDGALPGTPLNVGEKLRVLVQTNEVVTKADSVFCVNAGADAGKFRTDATAATAVPSARFESYDADTGLAELSINLP